MTLQIIIKGKNKYGRTVSEIAENLKKDGISTDGLYDSETHEDKARWLDKKHKLRKLDENEIKRIKRKVKKHAK